MNLEQLNILLNELAINHTRENVLNFSFALIEWMGLEQSAGKNPQLIAPKTQKLKEFLVTAPKTMQPQLYRLTADNQSVRIRFAVLKKIKKDYINQLVDNDPGAESFQNTPDPLKPVTKAPYFIHFVTTGDYDKLVLIFNQGDQKRIISFRNRLTNTQYFKVVSQWAGIGKKLKPEIADLLWRSLDIKEVNKEFYRQIKERFDALIGILKNSGVVANENQLKQFSVRLIGRYIFCWFLREKAVIPHSLISSDTIKDTPKYFQTTLLRLFFDTLNTKVNERRWLMDVDEETKSLFEKIPYLNGGLFDESDEDKLFRDVDLDKWLIPFVSVLENYDFTVDESSSTYQQIAVDPEMLGRIFENLLASQNPETEKAANNERKAFGAFYTPREIVDYMVDESIRTYLSEKLNVKADDLASAFLPNPVWPEKLNKKKHEADKALQEIKILDPACGSGAFPMGVLHRLISLRELIGLHPDTYLLKKEILSNNIYGVDIMPMAIEIARLRAWLSLIVEEDYRPDKPKNNFGIDALPNLDFKFMQGNSLLETYEGIKLFDESLLTSKKKNRKQSLLEITRAKVAELQSQYLDLNAKGLLKGTKKAILDKELKEQKELLKKILAQNLPGNEGGLFTVEENALSIAERLKKMHTDFFKVSDKDEKREKRTAIENLEWTLIEASLKEHGKDDKLKDLQKLRSQNIKPYFLYKLNFPEVFEQGGFDVVIGNPPYVRQEAIDPYYKPLYIKNHPEVGSGTADLYVYFFDSALYVAKPGGVVIFITLNKYLKTKYGEGLRKKFQEKNVDLIIDFFELPVFEASTDTAITKIINSPDTNTSKYYPVKTLENLDINQILKGDFLKVIKDDGEWLFVDKMSELIFKKVQNKSVSLNSFIENKIFSGIKTGLNKAFVLDKTVADKLKETESFEWVKNYAKSTSISKYELTEKEEFLLFVPWDFELESFPSVKKHLSSFKEELLARPEVKEGRHPWFSLSRYASDYWKEFLKPKLIYIHTAKYHEFYLDLENRFINNSCYAIISDNKYLFFYLNSKLFNWFKRIKFVAYGDADEAGRVKLDSNKMVTVPIKEISQSDLKYFENKYEEIQKRLAVNKSVRDIEEEVDSKLCHLYKLTYEEAQVIDPDLSKVQFEKFK